MIPQEKSAAVTRGLREAFGVSAFEDIRELTGPRGANPVYRIVVRGSAFLLRINLRAGDVARHYACMNAAAQAGLAPKVWYTSIEDRVSITDFVKVQRFPAEDALVRIPTTLRALHALPAFPGVPDAINTSCMFLINQGPARDGFLEKFRAANILPEGGTEVLLAWHARLAAVYPRPEADLVSSHNDLFKPDNMLFDGERVWLVDWEAAFRNDRYADLGVVANQLVTNDSEEQVFLETYFGKQPDPYQRARLYLARQLAHMFYVMAFLFPFVPGPPIDWSEAIPEYNDFHRSFWEGAVTLTDPHTKTVYGRVHWERLVRNMRDGRFDEALRIASGRQAMS